MSELFADLNFWDLIVAILALGVGAGSVWLVLRDRKGLRYRVDYSTSLVSVQEDVRSEIKIFYRDEPEPLKNPRVVGVRFKNTGRRPILREDFDKPLALVFGDDAKVISVEVESESPEGLDVKFELDGEKRVVIEPLLLNSEDRFFRANGDQFLLKILGENISGFSVEGRIVGVSEIEGVDILSQAGQLERGRKMIYASLTFMTVIVCILAIAFLLGVDVEGSMALRLILILPALGSLIYLVWGGITWLMAGDLYQ